MCNKIFKLSNIGPKKEASNCLTLLQHYLYDRKLTAHHNPIIMPCITVSDWLYSLNGRLCEQT